MKLSLLLLLFVSQLARAQTSDKAEAIDYSNVTGNPFLFKDWSDGIVRFSSGRTLDQFKLKFDCARNILMLQFNGSTFAAESKVQEFVLFTKSGKKKDSLVFRKGFPPAGKATDNTYYHVLFEGKVTLLRLLARNVIEEKMIIATPNGTRRMEEVEYFYFLRDGVMTLLPPDKNDILKLFPEHKEPLSKVISDNQLKMRSAEDFLQFAKKYNELL